MQVTPAVAAEDQLNARVHQPHPDNETRPDQQGIKIKRLLKNLGTYFEESSHLMA